MDSRGRAADARTWRAAEPRHLPRPVVGSLLSAIALTMISESTGTNTVGEGIVLGLVVGVGFAISIALVTATFEAQKPNRWTWGAVNARYHLVGNVVAAIIIAAMD